MIKRIRFILSMLLIAICIQVVAQTPDIRQDEHLEDISSYTEATAKNTKFGLFGKMYSTSDMKKIMVVIVMFLIVLNCANNKKEFTLEDINLDMRVSSLPIVDGENVIIEITKSGICGSDIHYWDIGNPSGLVMGHEFAGKVIDVGNRNDLKKKSEIKKDKRYV